MNYGHFLEILNIYSMIGVRALIQRYGDKYVKGVFIRVIKRGLYKIVNDWKIECLQSLTFLSAIFFSMPH